MSLGNAAQNIIIRLGTTERINLMVSAYRNGKTLQEIGETFAVTRERVRQVLQCAGIDRRLGGAHLRTFVRAVGEHNEKVMRTAKRIAKMESVFGCCHDEIIRICGKEFAVAPWSRRRDGKSIGSAYLGQRNNAQTRGIVWGLALTDWWQIWQDSGQFANRGRGSGYMMARFGDAGAYELGNVEIITGIQNSKDQWVSGKAKKSTRAKLDGTS